jgi:hypothetical protein
MSQSQGRPIASYQFAALLADHRRCWLSGNCQTVAAFATIKVSQAAKEQAWTWMCAPSAVAAAPAAYTMQTRKTHLHLPKRVSLQSQVMGAALNCVAVLQLIACVQ